MSYRMSWIAATGSRLGFIVETKLRSTSGIQLGPIPLHTNRMLSASYFPNSSRPESSYRQHSSLNFSISFSSTFSPFHLFTFSLSTR